MKDFVNILHFCLLPICASNIQLFLPGKILTACERCQLQMAVFSILLKLILLNLQLFY